MLQFITHPSERYSIAEQVQMVLEGGCRWVQLRLKEATDDEFRQVAAEVMPLCQEVDAFLVFDDRVELANEMRVHGVHLGPGDMPPAEARELLGPHAVIGVTAHSADDILRLRGLDVDYVGLGPFRHTDTKRVLAPTLGLEGYANIMCRVRTAGMEIPVVAIGGVTARDVKPLLLAGVNGVAVSSAIINAPDPVEYTREILNQR